ncbi:hypothetical protein COS75_03295 [Candidatus Pacearchaeota archaeon CG06_land_8_20_14_3_00_35_12]|nr:MAG: hypothetical protein COS75_03295 [Candidatus Pacearchaeota archaeon CG06_land_8_20_14_3_00_35_12]
MLLWNSNKIGIKPIEKSKMSGYTIIRIGKEDRDSLKNELPSVPKISLEKYKGITFLGNPTAKLMPTMYKNPDKQETIPEPETKPEVYTIGSEALKNLLFSQGKGK